ncbi:hypothetical protein H6P81_006320 [Aristolochia fimbriata]|uniref:Retrotransposon Copia-like N-terminal domain-containing protein n=1 Tax=Aristolochia fimbriata TaxID=158543 RepID=A0AAV7EZS3_ARIFI|nr:hypothetical protein H6P81_006320 [Aristolochia fimbriata]
MASTVESVQIVPVKLDNSNYVLWASLMRNFLKGRNLWKYVTGNCKMPIATSDVSSTKAIQEWEINNSWVITLLASAVSPSISLQVGKFELAVDAWSFLEKRFVGTNIAQKYKLEIDIRSLCQGPLQSISDFYAQMSLLWDKLPCYIDEVKLVQFLMALREDYESVWSSMLHRIPLLDVECALPELLLEVTRRFTEGPLGSSISDTETVFAAAPRRSFSSSVPKSR